MNPKESAYLWLTSWFIGCSAEKKTTE